MDAKFDHMKKMKIPRKLNILRVLLMPAVALLVMAGISSCEPEEIIANFEDTEDMSILTYLQENDSLYGRFLKVLEAGGMEKTMSAYNPYNDGYTLFLPDSAAIDEYIQQNPEYSSFDDLLADAEFTEAISKYHIVSMGIDANDFPFGALPVRTLSEDFLTVSFIIETDTSYYKINNQAPVKITNIELSNGYIHVISKVLNPITFTTYDWISQNPEYSIFSEAVEATGFNELLDINMKDEDTIVIPTTLLIEADSVFHKKSIFSLQDLVDTLGEVSTDYTSSSNDLYQYVGYHIIDEYLFLDDFADRATNYTTYSDLPVNINGKGLDIVINKGKVVFDTLIENGDTTIIDYVGFNYDASNVLTQSGAVHMIDQVMEMQTPSRARQVFEFYEEPLLNEFRQEAGEYIIDDSASLHHITWKGAELNFIEGGNERNGAWGNDYLKLDGDFSITYNLPKIVQGAYDVSIRAHAFGQVNAVVEVYIDGKKLGGLIDLSTGGNATWPFSDFVIGTIDFNNYERHSVEIRSLIPGNFGWDYVRFDPETN